MSPAAAAVDGDDALDHVGSTAGHGRRAGAPRRPRRRVFAAACGRRRPAGAGTGSSGRRARDGAPRAARVRAAWAKRAVVEGSMGPIMTEGCAGEPEVRRWTPPAYSPRMPPSPPSGRRRAHPGPAAHARGAPAHRRRSGRVRSRLRRRAARRRRRRPRPSWPSASTTRRWPSTSSTSPRCWRARPTSSRPTPFAWTPAIACGKVSHKAIELHAQLAGRADAGRARRRRAGPARRRGEPHSATGSPRSRPATRPTCGAARSCGSRSSSSASPRCATPGTR